MKTLQQSYSARHIYTEARPNAIQRFFNWCKKQEKNRLGWLAFIVAGHGCVFTPLTVFVIMITGNNPVFWPFAIGAMGIALVSNLAAMPTRITLPIFFLSLVIDVVIIVNCIAAGFSFPATA